MKTITVFNKKYQVKECVIEEYSMDLPGVHVKHAPIETKIGYYKEVINLAESKEIEAPSIAKLLHYLLKGSCMDRRIAKLEAKCIGEICRKSLEDALLSDRSHYVKVLYIVAHTGAEWVD